MPIAINPETVFILLLERYGPRGWWPLLSRADTAGFDARGYHPGLYSVPDTVEERWEILAGSILTQNTAWRNVEKALASLFAAGINGPERYLELTGERRIDLIRSAGYFTQKSVRLETVARTLLASPTGPAGREELLALNGVGPETADSMLLYAWGRPWFVVDLYTIRLFTRTGLLDFAALPKSPSKRYEHVQNFITASFVHFGNIGTVEAYQEFHALVVHNAKEHCAAKPRCAGCPLERYCPKLSVPL